MPMSVYVGPPGSGKTYEAVAEIVVPAVLAGRRVVTNINGLSEDELADFTGVRDPIVVLVTEDQLRDIASYPTKERPGAIVQGGDLIVVDEAHNVFPATGAKGMDQDFLMYFRTHRHFTDEQGRATDIVFISQAINDIHVGIRRACEFVFNIRNLRSFGLSKRYKVIGYMGWRMSEKEYLTSSYKTYDPRIFKLYSSFAGGVNGSLAVVDSKQRVVTKGRMIFFALLLVAGCALTWWGVHRFLAGTREKACSGTGVIVDWEALRVFRGGAWHDVESVKGEPGARRVNVGDCYVREGG